MTRKRLMTDPQLEEIRSRILTVLTMEPLGLTLSELSYRLRLKGISEHYVRTELKRLLEGGQVESAKKRAPLTGRLLVYYTERRYR